MLYLWRYQEPHYLILLLMTSLPKSTSQKHAETLHLSGENLFLSLNPNLSCDCTLNRPTHRLKKQFKEENMKCFKAVFYQQVGAKQSLEHFYR